MLNVRIIRKICVTLEMTGNWWNRYTKPSIKTTRRMEGRGRYRIRISGVETLTGSNLSEWNFAGFVIHSYCQTESAWSIFLFMPNINSFGIFLKYWSDEGFNNSALHHLDFKVPLEWDHKGDLINLIKKIPNAGDFWLIFSHAFSIHSFNKSL